MDSNSVWEAPVPSSRLRVDARQQQAWLRQAQEKLHGARLPAASQQQELAVAPEEQVDAPTAWQQPCLAQEESLRAPQVERLPALESVEAEERRRFLLRPRSPEGRQGDSARQQQERVKAESQEEAEELPQRVSCAPLGRQHLSPLYPLLLFARLLLPLQRGRESARAPLPRLLLQSSWNAFFSRQLRLRANSR
jgi:hypothetical protein